MAQQCARRWVRCAAPRTLAPMKYLLKLALAGALAAVFVKWARQWSTEESDGLPTINPVRDAEPTVAEPLRDDVLRVAQNTPF
jgi:hypothetical protein